VIIVNSEHIFYNFQQPNRAEEETTLNNKSQ